MLVGGTHQQVIRISAVVVEIASMPELHPDGGRLIYRFIDWFMYPRHAKSFRTCFAYFRRLHSCHFEQLICSWCRYLGCFAREHELSEFCIADVCHCLPIFWTLSSPFGSLSGSPFGMNGHFSTDFLLVLLHTNPKGIWGPSMPTTLPNPAELLRCHQTWSTLQQQSAVSMHSPMPLCLESWDRAWSSSLTCFKTKMVNQNRMVFACLLP